MSLHLRHRPVPPSPVARWDARWKLASLLVAAVAAAVLERPGPAAVALAGGLGLLVVARLPRKWVRDRLLVLGFAVLPFLAVLPFTVDSDGPGWDVGPLRLSERGLTVAAVVVLRCLAVGCFGLAVVGTTPIPTTLAAAHRLRLPGLLVQVALLAYRYAFLLADELRRLRVALRVRGFRPKTDRHSYRTLGHVTGALLVRGADQADRVADAMRCRGFDGRFHTGTAFHATAADALAAAGVALAAAGLAVWDRAAALWG